MDIRESRCEAGSKTKHGGYTAQKPSSPNNKRSNKKARPRIHKHNRIHKRRNKKLHKTAQRNDLRIENYLS